MNTINFKKVRKFTKEHDYQNFSVVRVQTRLIVELGGRNSWIEIKNGNNKIRRRILGGSGLGFTKDAIELDYDSMRDLGCLSKNHDENGFYPCNLEAKKIGFIGQFMAHWNHPSDPHRIPIRISIVSLFLGVVSLLLALIALF